MFKEFNSFNMRNVNILIIIKLVTVCWRPPTNIWLHNTPVVKDFSRFAEIVFGESWRDIKFDENWGSQPTTSEQHCYDVVLTSFQRPYNFVRTSCGCWGSSVLNLKHLHTWHKKANIKCSPQEKKGYFNEINLICMANIVVGKQPLNLTNSYKDQNKKK